MKSRSALHAELWYLEQFITDLRSSVLQRFIPRPELLKVEEGFEVDVSIHVTEVLACSGEIFHSRDAAAEVKLAETTTFKVQAWIVLCKALVD
ncbi:hypothetical protein R1flu_028306 [Riccia fluitans]|uniref:Uncharacterized protein n=1 Tax=Riccia fluitans TaxID=41844 RepID=A0ABD1XQB9_9MARC